MNYSLIRSKTFWTLMFQFVTDAIVMYGNLLTPEQLLVINAVLTTVASLFHLQTGKSTSGVN
jgi:hypothetical protein